MHKLCCCSVTKLALTLCDSHGLQYTRLPCPIPSPRVCLESCWLSQWCHSTISNTVTLFYSCSKSFPASGSFPMSQLFTSVGQSIGVSASASVFPMNIQDWFPLGLTGLISMQFKGRTRVFSNKSVLRTRWPKHWRFSFSISLSNEHSGLISFRIDWFISLKSKGLSRVFSSTTGQKHDYFGAQFSL